MKKKEAKHVMSTEDALAIAVKAWATGVAPFIIAGSLLNDGFSQKQTETIMRWAYLKVRREQISETKETQKEES
jgi:hypothetical protein